MIHRIKLSSKDRAALAGFSPDELSQKQDPFDYRDVVIQKPWGHEYLIFQNKDAAVWALHMKKGMRTSFHCHPNKKTSLTVLAGEVRSLTHESSWHLKAGGGLIFDKGVFHSTEALNPDWTIVMEVETPTNKQDLFRIDDEYGRQGKRYEGHEYHTVRDDSVCHFHNEKERYHCIRRMGECELMVARADSTDELCRTIGEFKPRLVAFLGGSILDQQNKCILEAGDSMMAEELLAEEGLRGKGNLECLLIKQV